MLDTTPQNLLQEIRMAMQFNALFVESSREIVREYVGENYRSDWQPDRPVMNNHYYEWINLILPQIIHDNPQVAVTSMRSGLKQGIPKALEAGLNWWAPQDSLWETLLQVAHDAAFAFGVVMTSYETRPGGNRFRNQAEDQLLAGMPRCRRISPERWFCDPQADRYRPEAGEGRFAGHLWRADRADLIRDDRFDKEALAALSDDAGVKWDNMIEGRPSADRKQVYCYDIWLPEYEWDNENAQDPQVHGAIFTLATSQTPEGTQTDPQWLRKPRPFRGPSTGPYTLFGFGLVPNCPYPLSPFAATYAQVRAMNDHERSAHESAGRKKKIAMVDADNNQALTTIRKARDGDAVKVRDFKNAVHELELGGVTEDQYKYNDHLRERVDRVTGLSETARGNISVDTSATAIADAAAQRDARLAAMKKLFTRGSQQVLNSAGWFMFHLEDAVFDLPDEVGETFVPRPRNLPDPAMAEVVAPMVGMEVDALRDLLEYRPRVAFGGGESDRLLTEAILPEGEVVYIVSPHVQGTRYEDFVLSIEPYSMERTDQGLMQRRSMQAIELATRLLPLMQLYPQIPWEQWLDLIGQPLNMPGLGEQMLGPELLAQLRQATQPQMPIGAPQTGVGVPGVVQPGPALGSGNNTQENVRQYANMLGSTSAA